MIHVRLVYAVRGKMKVDHLTDLSHRSFTIVEPVIFNRPGVSYDVEYPSYSKNVVLSVAYRKLLLTFIAFC